MTKISQISGTGIHVIGHDIDTDRIIPARFLRCVTFDGLGEHAFKDDREQMDGQHTFDRPHHQEATILVVNANFGCGSSREHAPQAIIRWGIEAIVGESFAEIFLGNCTANGVPCVTAEPDVIQTLQSRIDGQPQTTLTLDLETMTIQCGESSFPVTMAEGTRKALMAGQWDTCGQLIQNVDQIQSAVDKLPYLSWQV